MRLTGIAILSITAALGLAGCNQNAGPEAAAPVEEAPAVGDTAVPVEAAPAEAAPEAAPAPEGEAPAEAPAGTLIPDNE